MDVDKPPATPLRSSVIYNDCPENPVEQRFWSRSGVITRDFNQSQRINSEETVPADSSNVSKTTTRQFLPDGAAGLNNVLAPANAAMTTNSCVPPQGKDNARAIFGNKISYRPVYEIGTKQWTSYDSFIEETQVRIDDVHADKLPASSPWHSQPQDLPQKKPRRRREHRPRIITEAKPRTLQSIPNPDVSKETPRVKQKYVRKKPLDKTPSSLSAEKFKEPVDAKETELNNKWCGRALNFDVEEQPHCKIPAAESTLVLESERQSQGVSIEEIQPKLTTLHLGQGIEVVLGTTEVPVAYSLNCSTSDLLKGYISVPKMQALDKPPSMAVVACSCLLIAQ